MPTQPTDPSQDWLEFTYGDIDPSKVMHARCECAACRFWAPVFGFQIEQEIGLAEEKSSGEIR